MAKINSSGSGKVAIEVTLDTKTMQTQTKAIVGGFADVEKQIGKVVDGIGKLNDKSQKNGLLELLKEISKASQKSAEWTTKLAKEERTRHEEVIKLLKNRSAVELQAARQSDAITRTQIANQT
ncbi:MAG: hypothetical protein WC998_07770, partial [Candidatus Paceibacterota bacterium]